MIRSRKRGGPASLALLALLALPGGCGSASEPPEPDAGVYSALVTQVVLEEGWAGHPDTFEQQNPIGQVLVLQGTMPEAPQGVSDYARNRLEAAHPSAFRSFDQRHGDPSGVTQLRAPVPVRLLPEALIPQILGDGWHGFYRRFPDAPGLISFSGIGFSDDRRQAVVYMARLRHGLWGEGALYLLEASENGWTVVDSVVLWEA